MITFTTKEDFEAAVMEVIHNQLTVKVYVHNGNASRVKVEVLLMDAGNDEGCISFDWDEE